MTTDDDEYRKNEKQARAKAPDMNIMDLVDTLVTSAMEYGGTPHMSKVRADRLSAVLVYRNEIVDRFGMNEPVQGRSNKFAGSPQLRSLNPWTAIKRVRERAAARREGPDTWTSSPS